MQHQAFLRSVEDIESWMDGVEVQLNSEDLGRDLTSVTNLLKRHTVSVCAYVCVFTVTPFSFRPNLHYCYTFILTTPTHPPTAPTAP